MVLQALAIVDARHPGYGHTPVPDLSADDVVRVHEGDQDGVAVFSASGDWTVVMPHAISETDA